MYTYAVVTKTHPEDLAMAFPLYQVTGRPQAPDYKEPVEPVNVLGLMQLRQPVFTLGEVLILDSNGREVCGPGRKPAKWYVETEEFDDIEKAVERAKQTTA